MVKKMSWINGSQSLVPGDQQQHHLGNCEKCKLSGPIQDLLIQKLWGEFQKSIFKKKKKDGDL